MKRLLAQLAHFELPEIKLVVGFVVLAAAAGVVRALTKDGCSILKVLSSALVSGLVGFVVGNLCLEFIGQERLHLVLALVGMSGWFGERAMALLFKKVQEALR
jgi:hypothetical protein